MWFDFPTPFEKGNIVWIPKDAANIDWDSDGGFVLKGLSNWKSNEFIRKNGDNTDMNAFGYFVNIDGTVYYDVIYNYMNLEYYKGPYKANERILPALSKFLKGDIEVDLLMCIYRKVMLDVASDDIMLTSWYSKELLYESGMNEK